MTRATLLCAIAIYFLPNQAAQAQHGHGFHVPMPDQELFVECRIQVGEVVRSAETILKLGSTMAPTDLDLPIVLPDPYGPVVVKKYLGQAVREQRVEPANDGTNAILLGIEGKKQSFERWLIAGDIERDRLTSMLGTWRYSAAASATQRDELYRQFDQERNRPPKLFVTVEGAEAPGEMAAKVGTSESFKSMGCSVKVLNFFPHFGYEQDTKKPINRSDIKENPAALVRIEGKGVTEERWVFAKFPDYNAKGGAAESIQVRLDCPVETKDPAPDFVLVTIGNERHEVWMRHDGAITSKSIGIGSAVPVPESNYTFAIQQFVPAGRLIEAYKSTSDKRGATTAIRVDVKTVGDARTPVWVELGKPRVIATEAGPVTVIFSSRPASVKGGS